jgi:hypothetical protein
MVGTVRQACYSRADVDTEGAVFKSILPSKNQVKKAEARLVPRQPPPAATEPYKLTPVFLGVSVALLVSYIGLWALPDEKYVFATLTNLCYIAAGLQREVAAYVSFHSASRLVGLLGSAPYVFVLLGSSSLAYHRHSVVGSWTHSLDILFGMVLVFHVFYTSFSVVVLKFFGSCDQFQQVARTGLAFVFAFMIFTLIFWFDDIYQEMLLFYLIFGPSAAVCGCILRFFLVQDPESNEQWRVRVYIALAEMTTLLLMVFAAIFAQCELIGVKYTINSNPKAYDFWHGNWVSSTHSNTYTYKLARLTSLHSRGCVFLRTALFTIHFNGNTLLPSGRRGAANQEQECRNHRPVSTPTGLDRASTGVSVRSPSDSA